MKGKKNNMKIIIGGGGTGGHVFPAIAIANELKKRDNNVELLFVGALGKMEMKRVPEAGYKIIGLPVYGFKRKLTFYNIKVITGLLRSMRLAKKIIKEFCPDIVVGVGGYASGPVLRVAGRKGIPTLLQEQNSYAGITNKMLAKNANRICVAYENMEKYFPKEKIVLTGNPVRAFEISESKKTEAKKHFSIHTPYPVLLILGGSLGSRTINNCVKEALDILAKEEIEVLWQTGKIYFDEMKNAWDADKHQNIRVYDFISRMDLAYNIADVIVSRAGASTISEICIIGKPSILVPSPNVAEDHQTKNAMALVEKNAARMVADKKVSESLISEAIHLMKNKEEQNKIAVNCRKLALPDAAENIVNEILKMA